MRCLRSRFGIQGLGVLIAEPPSDNTHILARFGKAMMISRGDYTQQCKVEGLPECEAD